MSINASAPYKGNDKSGGEHNCQIKSSGFTPTPHAVHFYFQINDGNDVEEKLRNKQQALNNARGEPATSGRDGRPHPHHLKDIEPDWVDGERQLGFFSSQVGYGSPNPSMDDLSSRYYDQHIQLYDDVSLGSDGIARDASKTKLVIEKREAGLYRRTYDDEGNVTGIAPFEWHPGKDGTRHDGTMVKVQTSFVKSPWEALQRAEWLLEQALGREIDYDIRMDTFRFAQPEVHIRYHRELLYGTTKELSDAAQLVTFEQGSIESGDISSKKGKWDIWGFESSTMERLGFDKGDLDSDIKSEYVKTYMLENPPSDPSKPGHHPKLEVKIHGGFHVSKWADVLTRANDICLTFADWSGIDAPDVVADDYFKGSQGPECAYVQPDGHRQALEEYYNSDELKYSLIGRIFQEQTDAYHDVLVALTYETQTDPYGNGDGLTYQDLQDKTGYSYSTVTERVGDLVKQGLLKTKVGSCALVTWENDRARQTARDIFSKTGKTAKDFVSGLAERARARMEDRDRKNDYDVNEDDDRPRDDDGYLILADTTASFSDLADWYTADEISDDDIQYRPPPGT